MKTTLTTREKEVLQHTSYGCSQKEVADILGISPHTVDVHLKNIKLKTGLQKATELECAWLYKRYRLPLTDIPEKIRKRIAAALFVLSLFTAVVHTTDMVRVFRTPSRTGRTASSRTARSRRNEYDYKFLAA